MNWKSIKNFLLILFLIVNIFLIATTIRISNSEKLSSEDIQQTVDLLNKNNIYVGKSLIPVKTSNKNTIHVTDIYYAQGFEKLNIIKTEDNRIYFELKYENDNNNSIIENIILTLKKYGFDTKNIKVINNDNNYKMIYFVNDLQVFNNDLTITLKEDKLIFEGIWYLYESKNTYTWQQTGTTYATNALINLISYKQKNGTEILNVSEITQGYYSGKDNINKSLKILSASPCYRLTTNNGILYYSISDGKFIE